MMSVRPALVKALLAVIILALLLSIGGKVGQGNRLRQQALGLALEAPEGVILVNRPTMSSSNFLLGVTKTCQQLNLTLNQFETKPLESGANQYSLMLQGDYQQVTALVKWLESQEYTQEIQGFNLQGAGNMVRMDNNSLVCQLTLVIDQ